MKSSGKSHKSEKTSIPDGTSTAPFLKQILDSRSIGYLFQIISRHSLEICIFLFSLFFILTISNPALFMNDEWITVNQLNQLDQGHQIVTNEGKYGVFSNGTPGPYFQLRNNRLGYSLMLPVLSLPALRVFELFGDSFRLLMVFFWTILGISLLWMIGTYYPKYSRWNSASWTTLGIAGFLVLLSFNILLYTSWPLAAATAPKEVAAVVFTNSIIFGITAVIIYRICQSLFRDTRLSIVSTCVCLFSSSYLFWATNAKDHILVAALFALIILAFIRYLQTDDFISCAGGFCVIGLLAWARPEVAFPVFLFATIFITAYHLIAAKKLENLRIFFKKSSAILFTIIGAIPFFINNYIVSGNPLKPTFYLFAIKEPILGSPAPSPQLSGAPLGGINPLEILNSATSSFFQYYHFAPDKMLNEFLHIIFLPQSGHIGLWVICPLFIIAIICLPLYILRDNNSSEQNSQEKLIVLLLVWFSLSIFFAYSTEIGLSELNSADGSSPDPRYFSPVYLPIDLIALISLFGCGILSRSRLTLRRFLKAEIFLIPCIFIVFLVSSTMTVTSGLGPLPFSLYFTVLVAIMIPVFLIIAIWQWKQHLSRDCINHIFSIVVAIPLAFQIITIIVSSQTKFNGYTFWIPLVDFLYTFVSWLKFS